MTGRRRALIRAAIGIAALAGAAVLVERLWVTAEERYARTEGLVRTIGPSQLERLPGARTEFNVPTFRAARAAVGRGGLGPLAWGAATKEWPFAIQPARGRLHVLMEGGLAALDAVTGRPLWERHRPPAAATIAPLRTGVALMAVPNDASDDRKVRVTAFEGAGEVSRALDLGRTEPQDRQRYDALAGMATDPTRDLLATVRAGSPSEVRLFGRGGRDEEWSVKVEGEWGEVAIAGDVVVVGNTSGDGPALRALALDDGQERWSTPAAVARGAAPPPERTVTGAAQPRARLGRLVSAGSTIVAHSLLVEDGGPLLGGRLVGLDARTGRLAWRGPSIRDAGGRSLPAVVGSTLVVSSPSDLTVAVDVPSGRVLWRRELGAGKDLGELIRSPQGTYLSGGAPMRVDPRTGRAEKLPPGRRRGLYWFTLGGAASAGRLVLGTMDGYLFAYRLAAGSPRR